MKTMKPPVSMRRVVEDAIEEMGMTDHVQFVSPAEAETCGYMVCMRWTDPPILPDNTCGVCFLCGHMVQHRPNVPRKPKRVCHWCAPQIIRMN